MAPRIKITNKLMAIQHAIRKKTVVVLPPDECNVYTLYLPDGSQRNIYSKEKVEKYIDYVFKGKALYV